MQRLRLAHGAKRFVLQVYDVREHQRVLVIQYEDSPHDSSGG